MTTSKKLWLGFGTLSALLAVSTLLILVGVRSLETDLRAVATSAEPMRAAVYEMDISAHGAGIAVLSYLHTADPILRDQVARDRSDFARFHAQFDRLASTAQHRELSRRSGDLHREFVRLGGPERDKVRPLQQPTGILSDPATRRRNELAGQREDLNV